MKFGLAFSNIGAFAGPLGATQLAQAAGEPTSEAADGDNQHDGKQELDEDVGEGMLFMQDPHHFGALDLQCSACRDGRGG